MKSFAAIVRPALVLGSFTLIALASVSGVYALVRPRIQAQETAALLANFHAIAPKAKIDRALLASARPLTLEGRPVTLYTSRTGLHFIRATTGKGYSGDITLLIGIARDNRSLLGVRTLAENETPGLGDKIETRNSPWILNFAGKSLDNTRFAVKKDGGDFDAFTGATITPRAVTNLVGQILRAWAKEHAHE